MDIKEYMKRRLAYHKRADARTQEKMNVGFGADEDIPYYSKVTDEMIIELIEKVEKIESLLHPTQEVPREKTPETKSRFTLG